MNDTSKLGPDWRDLMAAIGEILLAWGFLEKEIRDRLAKLHGDEGELLTKAPLLSRWREKERAAGHNATEIDYLLGSIEGVASIRNCIAHGLYSASANPSKPKKAAIKCMTNMGDSLTFTYAQLVETQRLIANVKNQIRRLDDPANP